MTRSTQQANHHRGPQRKGGWGGRRELAPSKWNPLFVKNKINRWHHFFFIFSSAILPSNMATSDSSVQVRQKIMRRNSDRGRNYWRRSCQGGAMGEENKCRPLLTAKVSLQVVVRMRPISEREKHAGTTPVVSALSDAKEISVVKEVYGRATSKKHVYHFDEVGEAAVAAPPCAARVMLCSLDH